MNNKSDTRCIAHYDLDSFFISVERLKNSTLIGKPVIVGGTSGRGVVSSCSYETRVFGVQSAMPMARAIKLCPEAIVVKGSYDSYSYYSRLVTEIIRQEVPVLEKASIDEFYIDLTGMDKFFNCTKIVKDLKTKILKETGLPVSYALASNKLISKIATNEVKPDGQIEVPAGTEKQYLAPLKIERMPGIGDKTAKQLLSIGIFTIKMLSEIPLEQLESKFGKWGRELWRKANGIDNSPVVPFHEQKSIGSEETFFTDTADSTFLKSELVRLTEKIAFQLRRQKKVCGCVAIKFRYGDFTTFTRQASIPYTASDKAILKIANQLFAEFYNARRPLRLIGLRLTDLVSGQHQINLFSETEENIKLYQALDTIRNKFGEDAVVRAMGKRHVKLR